MTSTLPDWMTATGPLPILERPEQPRDAGGRFASYYAELPPLVEPEPEYAIRRKATWAEIADHSGPVTAGCCPDCVDGPGPARTYSIPVERCPHGRIAPWAIAQCRGCAADRRATR